MNWLRTEIGRAPRLYAALLVALAAALVYTNSLEGAFHFDDAHHIVGNPFLRDAKYAQDYMHRPDMFSALPGHNMYRPAVLYSFFFNYSTGGYDPLHWRLTAIALHALCSVGIFLTACVLAGRFLNTPDLHPGALVAALLFAVHPVFSETVNYASARSSLLATCALVWAFWSHQRGQDSSSRITRPLWLGASLLLLAVSLLAKEIGVVFPALLLWTAFVSRRGALAALPAIALVGVYLYARQQLLGSAVIDFSARDVAAADAGSGGARPVLWNLYTQARVIAAYGLLFLAPFGLCVHRYVRVSDTPWELGVVGGALFIAALLIMAWRLRRTRPLASLGMLWFLIALAPTSSLIPLNQVMNEHRLYLPGVGVALFAASLVRASTARWLAPVTVAVLAALTLHRNVDWSDPVRLWRSAVETSPGSDGAWNNLGAQLRRTGDLAGAEAAFEESLRLNPESWDSVFNLGTLYLQRGRAGGGENDLLTAQRWLRRSLAIRPGAHRSRWFLAEVEHAMGRPEEAAAIFRDLAGQHARLYEMTRFPLARMALEQGDFGAARALYREALERGSDPVAALLGLARLQVREGDARAAEATAREAAMRRPHSPDPHVFLAHLLKGSPVAVRHLFEAQRRGYQPSAEERRSILGDRRP